MSDPTFLGDLLGPQVYDSTGAAVAKSRDWQFDSGFSVTLSNGRLQVVNTGPTGNDVLGSLVGAPATFTVVGSGSPTDIQIATGAHGLVEGQMRKITAIVRGWEDSVGGLKPSEQRVECAIGYVDAGMGGPGYTVQVLGAATVGTSGTEASVSITLPYLARVLKVKCGATNWTLAITQTLYELKGVVRVCLDDIDTL